jgi:hypothetical protein
VSHDGSANACRGIALLVDARLGPMYHFAVV